MSEMVSDQVIDRLMKIFRTSLSEAMQSRQLCIQDLSLDIVKHRWNTMRSLVSSIPNAEPMLEDLMCIVMPSSTSESLFKLMCIEELTDNFLPSAKVLTATFETRLTAIDASIGTLATMNLYVKYKIPVGIYDILVFLMMFHYQKHDYNFTRSSIMHATSVENNAAVSERIRNYSKNCLTYLNETCPDVYTMVEDMYTFMSVNNKSFLDVCCIQQSSHWNKFEDSVGVFSLEQSMANQQIDLRNIASGLESVNKLAESIYAKIEKPLAVYLAGDDHPCMSLISLLAAKDFESTAEEASSVDSSSADTRPLNPDVRKNSQGAFEERRVVTALGSSIEMWIENPNLTEDDLYLDSQKVTVREEDASGILTPAQMYAEQLRVASELFGTPIVSAYSSEGVEEDVRRMNTPVDRENIAAAAQHAEHVVQLEQEAMEAAGNPQTLAGQMRVVADVESRLREERRGARRSGYTRPAARVDFDGEPRVDFARPVDDGANGLAPTTTPIHTFGDLRDTVAETGEVAPPPGHFEQTPNGLLWVPEEAAPVTATTTTNYAEADIEVTQQLAQHLVFNAETGEFRIVTGENDGEVRVTADQLGIVDTI